MAARLPPAAPAATAIKVDIDVDALPSRNRRGGRGVFRHRRPLFVQPRWRRSVDRSESTTARGRGYGAARLPSTVTPPRAAAAFARSKRRRQRLYWRLRLPVRLLRARPPAKAVVVSSDRSADVSATALSHAATATAAAAASGLRVRSAPSVQVAGKPAPGRRIGRNGRRPPRRVRKELSLQPCQAQDEGAGQGEQERVEAQVHGEFAVGTRRSCGGG